MRTLTRIAGVFLCIAAIALMGGPARCAPAQADAARAAADSARAVSDSSSADSAAIDSAAAVAAAAAAAAAAAPKDTIDRFEPVNVFTVTSNDVNISLGNRLLVTMEPGGGWKITSNLNMERRKYRQRVMEDLSENAMSRAEKQAPGAYRLALQAGDSYSKKKTLGLGRFGQDIIYNDTGAKLEFDLLKRILGASMSKLAMEGEANKGTHDFKYDRSFTGSASGTLLYTIGDILALKGGGGSSGRREASYIGGNRFGPMTSSADSVRAMASFGRNKTKTVEVFYSWVKGVERKVMPPLGNTYEILAKPELAKQEEARNRAEQLSVNTYFAPLSRISVQTKFKHTKATANYRVDTRLSKESEENSIDTDVRYAYSARGSVSFGVSTSDNVWDYGPVSLSSFKERQDELTASLTQRVGDSLTVTMNGQAYLKQRYYLKHDANPRDADYLYYKGEFGLSAPFKRFSADIKGLIDRYETINIDNTLSGDNRVDYKYQLGPRISLKPARWLSLSQDYIVKIEFTDFVYTEDENYLNRTTTLNTRAFFSATRDFGFDFTHSYLWKDTGSYLRREAGEIYIPSNETFEHSLSLTASYEMIEDFIVKAKTDFRIQRSNVLASKNGERIISSTTTYESGGMRVGFSRTASFGERGGVALDVAYVRNYGPYITDERKEYWEADSELTLRF